MGIKLDSLKADPVRDQEGDWIDIPDLFDPEAKKCARLKVRSLDFAPYTIARGLLQQKFARKYGRRPVPPNILTTEYGRLYADHILLDWEGFDEPYSADLARERLTDYAYRRLVGYVEYAAAQLAEDNADFGEDAAKNSAKPSATT
jgi:hypothetical protein